MGTFIKVLHAELQNQLLGGKIQNTMINCRQNKNDVEISGGFLWFKNR